MVTQSKRRRGANLASLRGPTAFGPETRRGSEQGEKSAEEGEKIQVSSVRECRSARDRQGAVGFGQGSQDSPGVATSSTLGGLSFLEASDFFSFFFFDGGRYIEKQLSSKKKKHEDDADKHLAQKIMQNKSYSMSQSADDEYEFYEEAPGRKRSKKNDVSREDKTNLTRRILTQKERCQFCFENPSRPKHLVVSIGNVTYMMLPPWEPHESSTRTIDQSVWEEIRNYKKCLLKMFSRQEKDAIFLETTIELSRQRRHCLIECIPVPSSIAKQAPLYFKKSRDYFRGASPVQIHGTLQPHLQKRRLGFAVVDTVSRKSCWPPIHWNKRPEVDSELRGRCRGGLAVAVRSLSASRKRQQAELRLYASVRVRPGGSRGNQVGRRRRALNGRKDDANPRRLKLPALDGPWLFGLRQRAAKCCRREGWSGGRSTGRDGLYRQRRD
ncbi:hypothetical protein KSP39_PZI002775 [Platanthera zijinensis]|uniref:Cwf19-like C-terminal domain-containing protein n=1 Tax=Platanthera zijinensis TaxID=2320716 RepID=A0AAP0BYC7_9ASPA